MTPRSDHDVAIIGAGPAGSSLAIRLAAAGRRVLLVEKARFPREKLCGEFVSPECMGHLDELGVAAPLDDVGGSRIERTVFYEKGGRSITVPSRWFGAGDAVGISRARLDELLMSRARTIGVEVREGCTVTRLIRDEHRVAGIEMRSDAGLHENRAALVIDASGRSGKVAREHGPRVRRQSAAKYVAFKTHLSAAEIEPNDCEIYAYEGGYGGCNNVEGGLANICFIVRSGDAKAVGSIAERAFREIVLSNHRAAAALACSRVERPWLAVPIDRYGRRESRPEPGLLAVGDSAAFIDPFTGSGILLALQSAGLAAEAILGSRDADGASDIYRAAHRAAFDRRLSTADMLRSAAFHPRLASLTVRLLGSSDRLLKAIAVRTRTA